MNSNVENSTHEDYPYTEYGPICRWMTLAQAKTYCNINRRKLVELIRDSKIKGGKHQDKGNFDWFVDRVSIDKYMDSMTHKNRYELKFLEILRRLK